MLILSGTGFNTFITYLFTVCAAWKAPDCGKESNVYIVPNVPAPNIESTTGTLFAISPLCNVCLRTFISFISFSNDCSNFLISSFYISKNLYCGSNIKSTLLIKFLNISNFCKLFLNMPNCLK